MAGKDAIYYLLSGLLDESVLVRLRARETGWAFAETLE
jgi:hypothetical protein